MVPTYCSQGEYEWNINWAKLGYLLYFGQFGTILRKALNSSRGFQLLTVKNEGGSGGAPLAEKIR